MVPEITKEIMRKKHRASPRFASSLDEISKKNKEKKDLGTTGECSV